MIHLIEYATTGGKYRDKHLLVTVTLADNLGDLVAGASVAADFYNGSPPPVSSGNGTTGTDGSVTFTIKNAANGTYTTVVTQGNAAGLFWDGTTPGNSFTKE